MLLTWVIQIFENLCLVHSRRLLLPVQILIHQNLHCQLHHQSLDTRYEQRQQFFQENAHLSKWCCHIPTTVLKGWLLNYCTICTFHQVRSSICLLGVQQTTVSTRCQHGKMEFSSRFHFWVNFWNLSLLMFFLLLPYELQVYSSKMLIVSSSSVTWFPNIDSVARNFGFTQAFSKKYFSLAEKWGCIITSSEWVETYHFWTLLIINSLIAHNHSSRFTIAIVIYHTFGWIMNNCHHNYVGIAWRRQYNNKLIIGRNI